MNSSGSSGHSKSQVALVFAKLVTVASNRDRAVVLLETGFSLGCSRLQSRMEILHIDILIYTGLNADVY